MITELHSVTGFDPNDYIPVSRDLPAHDVAVYFLTLRDESHTWGIARRRGVRWYYADVAEGREMPNPPTHWKPRIYF